MKPSFIWTPERIDELKHLVIVERQSFSQVARIMGCETRNVPLCKFNRLREKDPTIQHPGADGIKRAPAPREPRQLKAKKEIIPAPTDIVPVELDGAPVRLLDLTSRMCRYPIGDPHQEDFRFCGHAPAEDSSYCPTHKQLCCIKALPKKENHVRRHAA